MLAGLITQRDGTRMSPHLQFAHCGVTHPMSRCDSATARHLLPVETKASPCSCSFVICASLVYVQTLSDEEHHKDTKDTKRSQRVVKVQRTGHLTKFSPLNFVFSYILFPITSLSPDADSVHSVIFLEVELYSRGQPLRCLPVE